MPVKPNVVPINSDKGIEGDLLSVDTIPDTDNKMGAVLSDSSPTAALGAVISLMNQSKLHRFYTVQDIMRTIVPPIVLGQCRLYRHKGVPIGFVSWAYLDEEAELGYVNGTRLLQPKDWQAGDRLWFIDLIFPFGGRRAGREEFLNLMPDAKGKCLRFDKDRPRRVFDWYGKNLRASPNKWWKAK